MLKYLKLRTLITANKQIILKYIFFSKWRNQNCIIILQSLCYYNIIMCVDFK